MQESVLKCNDTEELSNSMFLNVITSSVLVVFPKLFWEELLGFSTLG